MACWMGMIDLELTADRSVLSVYTLLFLRSSFPSMDAALSSYAAMFISVSDKETISFKFLWFVQTKLITIFYTICNNQRHWK